MKKDSGKIAIVTLVAVWNMRSDPDNHSWFLDLIRAQEREHNR